MKRNAASGALIISLLIVMSFALAGAAAAEAGSAETTGTRPILIHDGGLGVRVGESRVIMRGVQPYLYSGGDGVLLVQSQLSEKPLGDRRRINHYPWQLGNRISRDFGAHWEDFNVDPQCDEPLLEGGGLHLRDRTLLLDSYITPAGNPDEGEGDLWIGRDGLRTIEKPVPMKFHLPGVDYNASKDDGGHEHRAIRLHRSLIELPGGDLLTTAYCCIQGDNIPCPYQPSMMKQRTILLRSLDGARTWALVATVAAGNVGSEGFVEPVLCRLAKGPHAGRLICLMRTGRDLHQAVSDDEGKTWSKAQPVAFPGIDIHDVAQWKQYMDPKNPRNLNYPVVEGAFVDPDLSQLANGVLVCAVGVRIPEKGCWANPACPRNGNYLAFSRDGGDTWSHVVQLTSGVMTTHYMALREIRPNQLYVTYDLGFWGKPDNRVMGCTVDVFDRKGDLSR